MSCRQTHDRLEDHGLDVDVKQPPEGVLDRFADRRDRFGLRVGQEYRREDESES